jgi:hypothetical protein
MLGIRTIVMQAHLMPPNAVLLIGGAQRDRRYDCASARIRVRPNVDGASAKAVECCVIKLLRPIEVNRSVDGGS